MADLQYLMTLDLESGDVLRVEANAEGDVRLTYYTPSGELIDVIDTDRTFLRDIREARREVKALEALDEEIT